MTAERAGCENGKSEKHISTVIHGKKNISAAFARKLEYALGIETLFWMNLQVNYDRELLEFEELNNSSLCLAKNVRIVDERKRNSG